MVWASLVSPEARAALTFASSADASTSFLLGSRQASARDCVLSSAAGVVSSAAGTDSAAVGSVVGVSGVGVGPAPACGETENGQGDDGPGGYSPFHDGLFSCCGVVPGWSSACGSLWFESRSGREKATSADPTLANAIGSSWTVGQLR